MYKKIGFALIVLQISACSELQNIVKSVSESVSTEAVLSNSQIGNGLKEALENGIEHQVTKLASEGGFYTNDAVKILLPTELQKVDKTLRSIGLGSLADKGLLMLNSAAEDAVKQSIPVFVTAVEEMTFSDVKTILFGNKNAATVYLENKTKNELYAKFNPTIKKSFSEVGADQVWSTIISKYNSIPFIDDVNPDLTDYVTQEALQGVFTMIAVEEVGIREKVSLRSSTLLQQVFALQDKK